MDISVCPVVNEKWQERYGACRNPPTVAIFIARQILGMFRAEDESLYYAIVGLEKAFDIVPREVVWWALRKTSVKE